MPQPQALLERLNAIGDSLRQSGQALALLALGSVGEETARMDAYSDLDFFVIVRPGALGRYLEQLDWLEAIHPVAYAFKNTDIGYKVLFEDDIFCEFAIFEAQELATAVFSPGRLVWQAEDFDPTTLKPTHPPPVSNRAVEWCVGEAVTNLYVGLGRYRRGECLSAARFIQGYAIDRLIELAANIEDEQHVLRDVFAPERRVEKRFPNLAQHFADFMQGYDRSIESALAILAFLEAHFEVNTEIARRIRQLAGE